MAGATVRASFSSVEMQEVERMTLSANVPPDLKRAQGSDNTQQISRGHYSAIVTL